MFAKYLAVVFVAVAAVGCNPFSVGQKVAEAVERKALVDECNELAAHPDRHLLATDMTYYDEGIINDYRQLSSVTVFNLTPHCAVTHAEGHVEWFDARGRSFGTTTFSLNKGVSAGGIATFKTADDTLSSTTIRGAATRSRLTFTSVDVVRPISI